MKVRRGLALPGTGVLLAGLFTFAFGRDWDREQGYSTPDSGSGKICTVGRGWRVHPRLLRAAHGRAVLSRLRAAAVRRWVPRRRHLHRDRPAGGVRRSADHDGHLPLMTTRQFVDKPTRSATPTRSRSAVAVDVVVAWVVARLRPAERLWCTRDAAEAVRVTRGGARTPERARPRLAVLAACGRVGCSADGRFSVRVDAQGEPSVWGANRPLWTGVGVIAQDGLALASRCSRRRAGGRAGRRAAARGGSSRGVRCSGRGWWQINRGGGSGRCAGRGRQPVRFGGSEWAAGYGQEGENENITHARRLRTSADLDPVGVGAVSGVVAGQPGRAGMGVIAEDGAERRARRRARRRAERSALRREAEPRDAGRTHDARRVVGARLVAGLGCAQRLGLPCRMTDVVWTARRACGAAQCARPRLAHRRVFADHVFRDQIDAPAEHVANGRVWASVSAQQRDARWLPACGRCASPVGGRG